MEDAYSDVLIEKYLSGELSDEEKGEFEKQLDMDESLQQELEVAVKARAAIYVKGIDDRKKAFAERWQEQKKNHQPAPTRRLMPYFAIAAAVIALLFLFNFFQPGPQLSNQEVFAQYYELPLAPSIRAEEVITSFKKANAAFHQQKYREAATFYVEALSDSHFVQKDEARFFAGICFLELKQGEKALELFDQLSGEDYLEMKNWYSVLAYLQLDQRENAKKILLKIQEDPAHFYHEKAQEMIEKL